MALGCIGYDPCKRRLARSRGSIEYDGGELVGLYSTPQEASLAKNMLLTHILIERTGPHSGCKRLLGMGYRG